MLDIGKETSQPTPKCYFSSTTLPAYLDPTQQPTKRPPFNTLYSQPYYHTLSILTPSSNTSCLGTLAQHESRYAKLKLPLLDILTGDIFTKHIKTGNVVMISAPLNLETTSSTATFTLVEGVLSITCDKALYERAGLTGVAIPDPHARKHGSSKFKIELNLRLPSMLKGKKGFERVLRAAETVFTGDISWLYFDIEAGGVKDEDETLGKKPKIVQVQSETEKMESVLVPAFPGQVVKDDEDAVTELLEWISLAAIASPRIQQGDLVDEIISRYEVSGETTTHDLTKTTWHAFLPASFVADVFAKAAIEAKESWYAIVVQGFEEGSSFVILKTEDGRALTWKYER